jgi:NNP family nitrate/nitrite transporter-like MFS transporter
VAGIVGAGGNAGAVLAGFLFKTPRLSYPQAFFVLGALISLCSVLAFAVRFSEQDERSARQEIEARLAATLAPAAAAGD